MPDKLVILKDLKDNLQKQYHDCLKNVILFGSQAKNFATENSDYDVLILHDKKYTSGDENDLLDICYDIDLKYNIIIDAHLLSIQKLSTLRARQPIFTIALKSGIYA